ncbi:hypothetical protein BH09VER1_BH09VER1_26160 [soil metagenome]
MKERIAEINASLNSVHTVLTKLLMNESRAITDKDFCAIEEAEELLNNLRTQLAQLSA